MVTTVKKEQFYGRLLEQVDALLGDERDAVANMSNLSALLFMEIEFLNWAGFHLLRDEQRVVGPFQGKPACVRIDLGKGVCGTAALSQKPRLVEDVHTYPGHIACDSDSDSELVTPMLQGERLLEVLDLDSPVSSRFTQQDLEGFL